MVCHIICWMAAAAIITVRLTAADVKVARLLCDSIENPLGVDAGQPRLSWELISTERGARQTAWQVLVASTPANLARDRGDLWDSGKVASDAQLGLRYGGPPLQSSQQVFWKVRVWDETESRSDWSTPGTWTMGILSFADWGAKWITHPAQLAHLRSFLGFHSEETREPLAAKWIQLDLGRSVSIDEIRLHAIRHTVPERLGFPSRLKVEVSDQADFSSPRLIEDSTGNDIAPAWTSDVSIAGGRAAGRFVRITATQLRIADSGAACLAFSQIEILSDGVNIARRATVSASDSWERGVWSAASVVDGLEYAGTDADANRTYILSREFRTKGGVRRALLNVCGLGSDALSLNGRPVSEDVLGPGWTNTAKTCLYDTYDITGAVLTGLNEVSVTLAGGMYRVPDPGERYTKFTSELRPLAAIAQIRIEYSTGEVEMIGTDKSWRAAPGPTTFAHVYAGEDFDARLAALSRDWQPVAVIPGPRGALRGISHAAPPLRLHESLRPVSKNEIRPGIWVYDLGQNASIMPRLQVRGVAGSEVKIVPAELLNPDGMVDRRSVGGGTAFWQYTLSGSPKSETWFPRFFYHGARFLQVELTGPAGASPPLVESLEGVVVHTSAVAAGDFQCSDDLFNRIRTLVRWAQRSNLVSVMTDCPHRERLGWLEQSHLNGPALRSEFGIDRLFAKTFDDMVSAQSGDGLVPDIAPEYTVFSSGFRDSPEWGSALILAGWQHYVWSGDDQPLRDCYNAMMRYQAYLAGRSRDRIVSYGLGDWFDIGPARPGRSQLTPIALTATAFYFEDTKILARIARVLDRKRDAERFEREATDIKAAINRAFFHPESKSYATGSQTSNALALVMDIAAPEDRPSLLEAIVQDVRSRGNAVTAGDVGYRYLLRALADGGRSDVIFDLNHQSEKPGYGYQLAHGATSLTEAWDAAPHASQDHFMLGQITEWFYNDLAGLAPDPASPGFKNVIIRPQPIGGITYARASHESPRGRISVRWQIKPGLFTLEADVPANATATVILPTSNSDKVTESGLAVAKADHVRSVGSGAHSATFETGSGRYVFEAPFDP